MHRTRHILVVEDEQTLRLSMVRGLAKLPNVKVADAGTVKDAKRLLVTTPPDLVISDLDLPDGSGIEVAAELGRMGLGVPIVFVSAYIGKFKDRLPTRGDFEVYEKPVGLEKLRAVVEDRLGLVDAAPPSPFGVTDYVQLAGMGRHTVVIEVRSIGGHGTIVINGGELWSAEDRLGTGIEAFRRLVLLGAAQVACRTLRRNELPTRDIGGSAESVLLEMAKNFDEAERDSAQASARVDDGWGDTFLEPAPSKRTSRPPRARSIRPASVRTALSPAPAEPFSSKEMPTMLSAGTVTQTFEEAFEKGVDALLTKDFARACAAFVEANRISPGDRHVIANLERLHTMGFS